MLNYLSSNLDLFRTFLWLAFYTKYTSITWSDALSLVLDQNLPEFNWPQVNSQKVNSDGLKFEMN